MFCFVFLSCGYIHTRNNYRHGNLGFECFLLWTESHLPSLGQHCILCAEHYGLHLELIIFLAPFSFFWSHAAADLWVGLDVHRTTQTNSGLPGQND